jgi:hypothetical protein
MLHKGRASRNSHATTAEHVSRDGVASVAGASVIPLNDEPVIDVIDADDTLIYQAEICDDCGHDRFRDNRCTCCGATAPWAAKLGYGLR